MKVKKNLKVSSLSGDSKKPTVEPAAEKIETIVEKSPDPAAPIESPTPAPSKTISPLLSGAVEIKAHAMAVGPQNTGSDSFKVDGDFFSTPAYADKKDALPIEKPAGATPTPAQGQGMLQPDVAEQKFNTGADALALDSTPIVDDAARQATSDLVDTIGEMYKRGVPEITHDKTRIKPKDIKEIKSLESKGEVQAGVSEELVLQNKENRKRFEERAASDIVMLKKPLKRWMATKNIPVPPYVEFLIVLIFIGVTYFFLIKEVKNSNDSLVESIYEKAKSKQLERMPFTATEEVK